jgi:hypothetical protein
MHHFPHGVRRYEIVNDRPEFASYKGWLLRDVPMQYREQLERDVATLEKYEMLELTLRHENCKEVEMKSA